jgi:hypothetical protein
MRILCGEFVHYKSRRGEAGRPRLVLKPPHVVSGGNWNVVNAYRTCFDTAVVDGPNTALGGGELAVLCSV